MRVPVHLIIGAAIAVTLQWLFFGRIQLWGTMPDVVLLFVLWTAVRYGRIHGALTGFFAGFMLDAIYGLWGIHMFVKTLIGFLVGLLNVINNEVFERSVRRIVEVTLIVSLAQNGLMTFFLTIQDAGAAQYLVWQLFIGSTLYTTFVAFLIANFWRR